MDFPRLIAQAGRQHTDLLISPASDWAAIDPTHTQMARFRAIEQGFNLLRQANGGLSAAYDYEGRTLARMDDPPSKDLTLVAEIPTRGVSTFYARWGDWFAGLCSAILVLIFFSAMLPQSNRSRANAVAGGDAPGSSTCDVASAGSSAPGHKRRKRLTFWSKDEDDDLLVRNAMAGKKAAAPPVPDHRCAQNQIRQHPGARLAG
jgi:hypothetical protein